MRARAGRSAFGLTQCGVPCQTPLYSALSLQRHPGFSDTSYTMWGTLSSSLNTLRQWLPARAGSLSSDITSRNSPLSTLREGHVTDLRWAEAQAGTQHPPRTQDSLLSGDPSTLKCQWCQGGVTHPLLTMIMLLW